MIIFYEEKMYFTNLNSCSQHTLYELSSMFLKCFKVAERQETVQGATYIYLCEFALLWEVLHVLMVRYLNSGIVPISCLVSELQKFNKSEVNVCML